MGTIVSEKDLVLKKEYDMKHKELLDKIEPITDLLYEVAALNKHFVVKDGETGIIPRIEQQTIKHNGRLSKLEAKYWVASGAIIVLGWISGFVFLEFKGVADMVAENHEKILIIDNRFEK